MSRLEGYMVDLARYAAEYASEEMGVALARTALSPNIRDRHDHTCAVLTPEGDLVAQAEHIPVHIGSMAVGVRRTVEWLRERGVELGEGDIVIVNDPYIAGTHLNDIMLMKAVNYQGVRVALLACKAHHVDVGGLVPGSIGGGARELREEGIIIPPTLLAEAGKIRWDLVELLAANVRTPDYLRGDLQAQIASLRVGEARIRELASRLGPGRLLEAWEKILDYSERYARAAIEGLGVEGRWETEDYVEHGSQLLPIRVALTIKGGSISVDFTGTSPQVEAPINAVYGVTVAATTFALKMIISPELPVNQGFYRAVTIHAPTATLVNPEPPAPVSAGNTETSQRIADTVLRALAEALPDRVPAAGCGTMTNLMLGGRDPERGSWAFYETIGCGSGARPTGDGVDGVHVNMTNTLNTPIERAETEYPILFKAYHLRPDSEGPGTYRGGLGIVRALTLTRGTATLTIASERCRTRPWGLKGGKPGEPSRHTIIRRDGTVEELPCKATTTLHSGDTIIIRTPGGGGYGDPCKRPRELVERDIREGKITRERARRAYCY